MRILIPSGTIVMFCRGPKNSRIELQNGAILRAEGQAGWIEVVGGVTIHMDRGETVQRLRKSNVADILSFK